MRRALLTGAVLLLLAAPTAHAAEVSGRLAYCEGSDICRYFPNPRLEVTFRAAPGEQNELRIVPATDGVRVIDRGAAMQAGPFCAPTTANDVRCGPPAPEGLLVAAFTGDGPDAANPDIGSVSLGRGNDHGIAEGAVINGGPGNDRLFSVTGGNLLSGGAGRDYLSGVGPEDSLAGGSGRDQVLGRGGDDSLSGGPGPDLVAGGFGRDSIHAGFGDDVIHAADGDRDRVRCGPGDDRAALGSEDRTFGCERVVLR